jgi:hypothetical protein
MFKFMLNLRRLHYFIQVFILIKHLIYELNCNKRRTMKMLMLQCDLVGNIYSNLPKIYLLKSFKISFTTTDSSCEGINY